MSTELIINASLPETRIAMMENGEIQELLIERASGKGIVGNIYKGRVTRVLPGMQAAFVDIGLEKAAFLYVDDVYVHSEIWEEEEGAAQEAASNEAASGEVSGTSSEEGEAATPAVAASERGGAVTDSAPAFADEPNHTDVAGADLSAGHGLYVEEEQTSDLDEALDDEGFSAEEVDEDEDLDAELDEEVDEDDEEDEDSDDHGPVRMGPKEGGDGDDEGGHDQPEGTMAPPASSHSGEGSQDREMSSGRDADSDSESDEDAEGLEDAQTASAETGSAEGEGREGREGGRRRHRRGRRGGKFRRRDREQREGASGSPVAEGASSDSLPENFESHVADQGSMESDRTALGGISDAAGAVTEGEEVTNRPTASAEGQGSDQQRSRSQGGSRPEFKEQRSRDRRIRPKQGARPVRAQVNIQDLLKEGQEVIVQVAKDPIATKGARLTCHISLPGRHLVCMPTIDHVGVSRRIERDDERRKLREHVERYRPKNLGFIVRTASGKGQSEKRIKQDIDYLTRLWTEIREKAAAVTAPALVYEDLNSVLRAIRDWVTEDIDKIIVDSRYHYNEILKFVSHFMPSLKQKVELYHGDIPIFDAYGISTELSRALERKVWLKSGGYIVIDQAEALVAIDVNTGRYVGKKNLEDTILKTNLEAVQEIAYQLRLRNCGGIIILDLIDMEKEENKQRVYRALEEALKKDRARPSILKISELGLVEMTRKRTRDTMVRALCESCSHCEGKGFIKSKQTVAYEALREIEREGIEKDVNKILVQAHADVIDILAIDERETMDQLERRYRKQIYLQAVMDYHPEQFEISGDKKEGAERSVQQNQRSDRGRASQDRNQRGGDRDRSRGGDRQQQGGRNQPQQGIQGASRDAERAASGRNGSGGSGDQRGQQQGGGRDDRNRRRDRDRDRNRNRQQQGFQGRAPIQPVQGQVSGEQDAGSGPTVNEDPDSQTRYLGLIEKKGYASPETPAQTAEEGAEGASQPVPAQEDFYDEEDRLAFLRAQAAQDAALARLQGAEGSAQNRGSSATNREQREQREQRDQRGPGGSRRGRRGRRGRHGDRGERGGSWSGSKANRDTSQTQPAPAQQSTQPSSTPASNSGGEGTSGGGGGDHSQPPV